MYDPVNPVTVEAGSRVWGGGHLQENRYDPFWSDDPGYGAVAGSALSAGGQVGFNSLADLDFDRDADTADAERCEACATRPAVPWTQPCCAAAGIDADGDVDQSDYRLLQRWASQSPFSPTTAPPRTG